jgi:hypothetical protein
MLFLVSFREEEKKRIRVEE